MSLLPALSSNPRPLALNRKPVSADGEVRMATQVSTLMLENKEFWVFVQTADSFIVTCIDHQTLANTQLELL